MKHDDASIAAEGKELSSLFREVARLATALAGEKREAEERRVSGVDGTGLVMATVSGTARLLRVRIAPRGMRELDHAELSLAVLEAVRTAREAAAGSLDESLGGLDGGRLQSGPEEDSLERVLDVYLREGEHG